eukprot:GSChrysophyteH2.ASY1.ANO1.813.1 assembled CDS
MNRKPTGGDEWMANPAWKKTAEHMIPKDHTPINNKPTSNLELEWVHGYRGYDCRNNLYYVDQTGSQVFFHIAGLGVVQCDDNGKKKQYFFGEHTDDVISLDTMDTADRGKLLATGEIGSHPAVCLYEWDAVTKQFLSLTSMRGFHTSGVCQVAFAQDGNSIFTVGAEYTIAIYDSNKNSSKFGKMLGSSQGPKDKVLHCASLPNGNFVSCGEKHISYWNFNGGNIRQDTIKLGSAHKRKLMMCVSHFGEDSYVVGTSGGDILLGSAGKLLDNKLCALKAHKKSVNSIWIHPSGTTMVTGDSSGHIIIWSVDPNSSKILTSVREFELPPVRSVCLSHDLKKCLVGTQACEIIEYSIPSGIGFDTKSSENEEVWGLGIRPRGRLDADEETYRTEYCTVGDDGVLRIWDLHSHEQKKFLDLKASARCCAYSPDGQYLAIGFGGSISSRRSKHNGAVRIFRGDTLQQVCEMKEAKQWISAIKFSPDGQALAVGARDNSVYIYSVAQQFKRKSKFSKHNAGILNFDFTSDGKYLQSTCSAYELLFSKTSTGEQVTNGATFLADQDWSSQTCTLGWPVIGIWSGSMDGSDVNSTDRSPSGNLIATGDDFGKVNCYKFPCTLPGGAPKNVYSGHSSHVTSVRWVSLAKYAQKKTDDFLISLGGGDKAIMQWKVVADGMTPLGEGPSGGDEFMAVKPWLGTIKAPSAWVAPDVSKKAPFYAALELEWVHGFTADFNNRNELHYVNSSEKEDSRFVVYPAAGLGIVVEMAQTTTKQKYFRGHTDDISSLAARDTEAGTMVATGQMGKGNTFVWEVPSMKTLAILKTGQKTVSSLEFSKADNGRLLVSMSPDATICVSDWKSETVLARVKDNTSANAYHLCSSSLASNFSFLACGNKFVTLWNMNGRNLTSSKVSLGRERTGLKFLCSAEVNGVFIVGCEDGLVYNCTRNKSKKAGAKFKNHVLSLHVDNDNNKLLVGSKNGTLSLFDTTEMTDTKRPNGRIVLSTRGADMIEIESWDSPTAKIITRGHCYNELWGLSTHPTLPEYCTTGDDMTLRTYSVTTKTMLSSVPLGAPARACDYNNDGSLIAVGFGGRLETDESTFFDQNHFKGVDVNAKEVLAQVHDAKQWVSALRFSADGHTLAVGAHDCKIYIYSSASLHLRCTFKKHNSVINHLDLSANGRYMQSNCSAYELLFCDTTTGSQVVNADELKDVPWDSWTCTLGWPVQGIWATGMDGSDINTVSRSSSGHLVATGDDFGKIRLFRYPSISAQSSSLSYSGHSSHVMNVGWTAADECLISCGGNDKCVMQWKHVMTEGTSGEVVKGNHDGEHHDDLYDDDTGDESPMSMGVLGRAPIGGDESGAVKPWLGTVRTPKCAPTVDSSAPAINMNLQWVHGYTSGSSCNTRISNNLHYSSDGSPVYPAAALGVKIVQDQQGGPKSQKFFEGHNDDILCMAIDPARKFVATGQVASKSSRGKGSICIWDVHDCRELCRMDGCHQRAVTSLAFSPDGTQLISIGQDNKNTHKLWTDVGGNWCRVQCTATAVSDQSTVFFSHWLQGNHASECALVSGGAKGINFWQLEGATLVKKQGRFGRKYKQSPLLCAANLQTTDDKGGASCWCAVVGTASGGLFSFGGREITSGIEKAHDGPVLCLAEGNKECTYLVSGGRDHLVRVWNQAMQPISTYNIAKLSICDASIGSLDVRPYIDGLGSQNHDLAFLVGTCGGDIIELSNTLDISNAHNNILMTSHSKGELWGLAVHPTDPDIYATVGDDKTLRIWSVKKQKLLHHTVFTHAARSVAWTRSRARKANQVNHKKTDSQHESLHLYKVEFSWSDVLVRPDYIYKKHSSAVLNFDFNGNGTSFQSNCQAGELLYGTFINDKVDGDPHFWASQTCTLGWPVQGIWPPGSDTSDINACDRSHKQDLLATVDDFGLVKVFRYPAVDDASKHLQFAGHSSHVTNVRWTLGENLITTGGNDKCVFVWRCEKE